MQCSKSLGYLAYPLVIVSLFSALSMQAQTSSDPAQQPGAAAPAATQDTAPAPAPEADQQPPAASTSAPQNGYPNEQERVRLAQEAQARVRARREQRVQAAIQDTYSHRYDVYFGYAYLRARPGHNLQHTTEYGWNAGITRYFRPKLGVSADFRGYYSNAFVGFSGAEHNPPVQGLFQPFISNYAVMVGPQYYLRQHKSYAISTQLLAGATRTLFFANSSNLPGTYVGLYPNQTRFTAAAVVPFDYNLGPGLAVRVAPTYNLTTWGGDLQHNLGFTLGVNYRFGRQ